MLNTDRLKIVIIERKFANEIGKSTVPLAYLYSICRDLYWIKFATTFGYKMIC